MKIFSNSFRKCRPLILSLLTLLVPCVMEPLYGVYGFVFTPNFFYTMDNLFYPCSTPKICVKDFCIDGSQVQVFRQLILSFFIIFNFVFKPISSITRPFAPERFRLFTISLFRMKFLWTRKVKIKRNKLTQNDHKTESSYLSS